MFARPIRMVAAALAVVFLAGCQTDLPVRERPTVSYSALKPWQLDVGRLELVTEYLSPAKAPNVEHIMPVSPERAIRIWATDRLKPMGRTGAARFVIKDARVVEIPLKVDTGVTGMFKTEQSQRYDASLDVAFQILDDHNFPVAEVVARASRSRTVPENIKLADREQVWFEIVKQLTDDINSQMQIMIPDYMSRWVQ